MRLIASLTLLVALAACTGSTPPAGSASPGDDGPVLRIQSGATATGAGISVAEALASDSTEPLLVNGALFVDANGTVRLCEAMAESFPQQCGGESVRVVWLDLSTIAEMQEEGAIRWAEGVQLLGTIER